MEKDNGYDYVRLNGNVVAVDRWTGEALPTVDVTLPVGSISYTPQQQHDYRARKLAEQESQMRRDAKNELGYFFFAETKDRRNAITSQSLARLMYLATYLRYESNLLYISERLSMKKVDLPQIVQLPMMTFHRFWEEVAGVYLFENDSGQVYISDEFFRGKLTNKLLVERERQPYQQVYIEALRQLYRKTPTTKHRYLGYVFMMLSFINFEFNILCWNPEETELENLKLMTLDELCEVIGYNKSQRARLLDAYRQLTFDWQGKEQCLCSFVTDDLKCGNIKVFVNPHILYRGSNWHRVEILGAFT